jgi:hypothetical protein
MTHIGHLGPLACTHVGDIVFIHACHIAMHHDIYMPCVLHPICGLLAPIICLVATMSSFHICHVPLLAMTLR